MTLRYLIAFLVVCIITRLYVGMPDIFGVRNRRRHARELLSATPPSLTVRNLTTDPLTIKLVERFQVGNVKRPTETASHHAQEHTANGGVINSLKKNFTAVMRNVTTSDNSPRATRAVILDDQCSSTRDVLDVRIDPFSTHNTSINAGKYGFEDEVLRFELVGDSSRWSFEIPCPSTATQLLQRLDGVSTRQYSAIFVESCAMIAILDSSTPHSWMSRLHDHTPLSALSIPGTHNSPTCYRALPSVRCQVASPREQLDNGVRFFDVRLRVVHPDDPSRDTLRLVHGAFPISLCGSKPFRPLVDDLLDFLARHPSETIILSLKREGHGHATDPQLSLVLFDHYVAPSRDKWFVAPRIPRLGEARGKIILMRRFALDPRIAHSLHDRDGDGEGENGSSRTGWGLDAENWRYNTVDDVHGDVRVQDLCEMRDRTQIAAKIEVCRRHFERAGRDRGPAGADLGPLFVNFLTAANFWTMDCWPEKIAAQVNPATTAFLCQKMGCGGQGPGTLGVVVCDWVGDRGDWGLVRTIVAMNGRLMLKPW